MINENDLKMSVTKKLIRTKETFFDPQVKYGIPKDYYGLQDKLLGACFEYVNLEKSADGSINIKQGNQGQHDGVFIRGLPDLISLGYVEGCGIIVSDEFAGCDFQFLVSSFGTMGAHVYSNNKCRQVMENLSLHDWNFKLTFESKGKARTVVNNYGIKQPTGVLLGFACGWGYYRLS